ncbi:MAG: hypothetical protein R3F29_10500 [Planctomycetota bacterium]
MRSSLLVLVSLVAGCAGPREQMVDPGDAGVSREPPVRLRAGAQTFVGSQWCSRPATIDLEVVRRATAEWREIEREGVREGSARHGLLRMAMHRRIVAACEAVALAEARDLVVRAGDIVDARGLQVVDLTAAVTAALGE